MAQLKGFKHSEETKKKISATKKAREQKPKIFGYNKGRKFSEEWKRKISESNKGRKFSEETRKKISKALKGKKCSDEHKRKLSLAIKGRKLSEEHCKNMSLALKGKYIGKLSHNWQGGKSFELYTIEWTETLKRSIRERDRYTCEICKKSQGDVAFSVHHIDYNKKNNNPNNLISLCVNCHSKTNHNRNYWINYFYVRTT